MARHLVDSGVTVFLVLTLAGLAGFSCLLLAVPGMVFAPARPLTGLKLLLLLSTVAGALVEKHRNRRGRVTRHL